MTRIWLLLAVAFASSPSTAAELALTFDDLPATHGSALEKPALEQLHAGLRAALLKHQAPAIGFTNESKLYDDAGQRIGWRVAPLQEWLDTGFELGNHGFAHRDLHRVSVQDYFKDIDDGDVVLNELLHDRQAARYFRHPYLHTGRDAETRAAVTAFLHDKGYLVAPVTIDNSEWIYALAYEYALRDGNTALQDKLGHDYVRYMVEKNAHFRHQARELFGRDIAHTLLLHANRLNGDWLNELLEAFTADGWSFISLQQALKDPAYQSKDDYFGSAGISWLHRWALTQKVEKDFFRNEPRVPAWVLGAANMESE